MTVYDVEILKIVTKIVETMASQEENTTKDAEDDVSRSSDFSYSVSEDVRANKHDLRRSIILGSDASSEIFVGTKGSSKPKLYCDLCTQEKKPAEGFCVNCNEYLCISCFNFHKKQKNLNHMLKDKSCMPLVKENRNTNDVCIDKCTIHKDKIIEYFCQSCDQLGCSACFVTGHRACKNVDFIQDIISGKETDEVCKHVKDDVQQLSDKLILHKNRVASNIERSNQLRKKANETIVKQRQEVESIFDRMENDMYARVDEIYNSDQSNLTEVSDLVNSLTSDVSRMHSELNSNSTNRCQVFVATKCAEKRMKVFENDVEKLESSNKVQRFQYIPSNQLKDELASIEIGKVKRINSETRKRLVSSRDINITHKEDVNGQLVPNVTGICLLGKCRAVIIDQMYLTCTLIHLRTEEILSYVEFDDEPFDVTNISDIEVAVTFQLRGEIKFLMVSDDGSMSEQRTIYVGVGCSGVHYFDGKLAVAFIRRHRSKPRIDIMDAQGHLLNTIENDEYGRRIIESPLYVTVSPDFSTIYVTDRRNGMITGMTMDGKVKYIYMLKRPCGLAVDEYGSIFVCSDVDSSIVHLSEDCELVNVLFQQDNVWPYAIAYCKEDQSFYITNYVKHVITIIKTENVEDI